MTFWKKNPNPIVLSYEKFLIRYCFGKLVLLPYHLVLRLPVVLTVIEPNLSTTGFLWVIGEINQSNKQGTHGTSRFVKENRIFLLS